MNSNISSWQSNAPNTNKRTSLRSDKCETDAYYKSNRQQLDYNTMNFGEKSGQVNRMINHDSSLRMGGNGNISTSTKSKADKLLQCRTYISTPYMGAGQNAVIDADAYSSLIVGQTTSKKKSCNAMSGVAQDRFIPLLPEVEKNIMDPRHIIFDGVWGGASTRTAMRNIDYLKACGLRD